MKLLRLFLILIAGLALVPGLVNAQTPKAGAQKTAAKPADATSTLLDINSASEADLKALPGIGDAYAAKIVAGRPYRAKNQLVQKKIIPQATYDKIKDKIIAKQSAAAKK